MVGLTGVTTMEVTLELVVVTVVFPDTAPTVAVTTD